MVRIFTLFLNNVSCKNKKISECLLTVILVFLRSGFLEIHVYLSQVVDQNDMQTTDVSCSCNYTSLVSQKMYKDEEGFWKSASISSEETFQAVHIWLELINNNRH